MKYWKRVSTTGVTTTVEAYSHDLIIPGAVEIAEAEYTEYLAALAKVAPPRPDYQALYAKAQSVEAKIDVIAAFLRLK